MPRAAAAPEPRGFALLLVLWGVMILAIIAAAMLAGANTAQQQAYGGVDVLRRTALEDAAIARAVAGALSQQNAPTSAGSLVFTKTPRWPRDGTPQTISFEGHDITVAIEDETGKVDLNAASKDTLTALFRTTDMSGADIEDLVNHIIDWRSDPKDSSKAGITPVEYQGLGYSYHSRHAAFQSIDELRLVDGMSPEIYDQVAPGITVYSGRPDIDPNTAPLVALMTLPGLDREKAIDVIAGRARGIRYSPPPGEATGGGATGAGTPTAAPEAPGPAPTSPNGVIGHALTITVAIALDSKRLAIRREVVRIIGQNAPVFLVLRDEERLQRR